MAGVAPLPLPDALGSRLRPALLWGVFLLGVLGLRLAGLGTSPPEAGAAARATVPTTVVVTEAEQAARWALLDLEPDLAPHRAATHRCLADASACAPDDLLELDSTHLQLQAVLRSLEPLPARSTTTEVAAVRTAAGTAAAALDRFLAEGCGGSIEGVSVEAVSGTCDDVTVDARARLADLEAALARWARSGS